MAKQKKLYYLPAYGQLGNQLTVIAHLLAFAIEFNYIVVYPQSDYFSSNLTLINNKIRFNKTLRNSFITKFASKAIRILFFNKNVSFFNYSVINKKYTLDADSKFTKQPNTIIINDWLFRFYDGVIKHQEALREQLSFTSHAVNNAKKQWLLLQTKDANSVFVGVHVRRGDYATWLNGQYFFDNKTYYTWMTELSKQIQNIVFIVCSNEEVSFTNKSNLNIFYAKGSAADDIFLLSKCAYIFGPPSTFSSWAAFLGNQNLFFVRTANDVISIDQFYKYNL